MENNNKVLSNIPNISIKKSFTINDSEKKVIGMFLCSLDKNNINSEYMFSLSKCCEELDLDKESFFKVVKSIEQKVLEITINDKNEQCVCNLFSYIIWNIKEDYVKIKFNNALDGLYVKIRNIYDNYIGRNLINLRGKYSWQTYELLKDLEHGRYYYASLDYLKKVFNIESQYKLYADFKRKVLLSTQREINEKTDLYFEFDEVKEEKKIVGIHIVVHRNNAFKNSKK